MATSEKLISELNSLIEQTKNKKISWSTQSNNPNGFIWDREIDGINYRVSIQGVNTQNLAGSFYMFNIFKQEPTYMNPVLQINTQVEPDYKTILIALYIEALKSSQESSANLLSGILKGL